MCRTPHVSSLITLYIYLHLSVTIQLTHSADYLGRRYNTCTLLANDVNLDIYLAAMQKYFTHTYGSHSSGLLWDSADFMGLKQFCIYRKILFGTPSSRGF